MFYFRYGTVDVKIRPLRASRVVRPDFRVVRGRRVEASIRRHMRLGGGGSSNLVRWRVISMLRECKRAACRRGDLGGEWLRVSPAAHQEVVDGREVAPESCKKFGHEGHGLFVAEEVGADSCSVRPVVGGRVRQGLPELSSSGLAIAAQRPRSGNRAPAVQCAVHASNMGSRSPKWR